MHLKIRN